MTRRSLRGARAIVTGASGGIGQQIAFELARRGTAVLITARREQRLMDSRRQIESSGGQAIPVVGDITEEATRREIIATAEREWGGVDLLVNNAGVGAHGPFADAAPARLRQIMEVNFFAPVELIRSTLPLLRKGRQPMVVNVSSVLGHRAVPDKSEYCASKFALHGFSDALRAELVNFGIEVLLVSPSTTESEFTEHVLEEKAPKKKFSRPMPASRVAWQTARAIERGRHEVILSVGGRLLVWADRLCPPLMDWLVAKYA